MRARRDPRAERIHARFGDGVEVVRRHRESDDDRRSQPIEFSRSEVGCSVRTRVDRTDQHLVEQVAVARVARFDLRHRSTESTWIRIRFVRVAACLRLVRDSADDGTDAICSAEIEAHRAAAVFDWAMTTTTTARQTLTDGTLAFAQIIHAARRHARARGAEQFFRYRTFGGIIERWIHRTTGRVCLGGREL